MKRIGLLGWHLFRNNRTFHDELQEQRFGDNSAWMFTMG